jgi:hypothetical protein
LATQKVRSIRLTIITFTIATIATIAIIAIATTLFTLTTLIMHVLVLSGIPSTGIFFACYYGQIILLTWLPGFRIALTTIKLIARHLI